MKRTALLLALPCLLFLLPYLQLSGQSTFQKYIPSLVKPTHIIPATDGGYVICGKHCMGKRSNLHEEMGIRRGDCFALKLTENGDTSWVRSLPGLGASNVIAAEDGGYYVTGYSRGHRETTNGNDKGQGVFLIKLEQNGTPEWGKMLDYPENTTAQGIAQLSQGKLAVLGETDNRYVLFMLNPDGSFTTGNLPTPEGKSLAPLTSFTSRYDYLQDQEFHAAGDWAYDICPIQDGGMTLLGVKNHGRQKNAWFVKMIDSVGRATFYKEFQWKRKPDDQFDWNTDSDDDNWGKSIFPMQDGSLLLGGFNQYHPENYRMAKVSPKGEIVWTVCIKGSINTEKLQVIELKDGSCVLAGEAKSTSKAIVAKFSADGKPLWSKEYPTEGEMRFGGVCESSDGGIVIAGQGLTIIKMDKNGNYTP